MGYGSYGVADRGNHPVPAMLSVLLLILAGTIGGCALRHEYLIRRVRRLRPLLHCAPSMRAFIRSHLLHQYAQMRLPHTRMPHLDQDGYAGQCR
jgi:hypothetical protein